MHIFGAFTLNMRVKPHKSFPRAYISPDEDAGPELDDGNEGEADEAQMHHTNGCI